LDRDARSGFGPHATSCRPNTAGLLSTHPTQRHRAGLQERGAPTPGPAGAMLVVGREECGLAMIHRFRESSPSQIHRLCLSDHRFIIISHPNSDDRSSSRRLLVLANAASLRPPAPPHPKACRYDARGKRNTTVVRREVDWIEMEKVAST